MSMIQSIIGSAGGVYTPPVTQYPVPGLNYPDAAGSFSATGAIDDIVGYYEAGSISNPLVGMWRRTYTGEALGFGTFDTGFPTGWNQVESMQDPYVGFSTNLDVAAHWTMSWFGYFKPEVTGDFVFQASIDDNMYMWLGDVAVSGFDTTNYTMNNSGNTNRKHMVAGRYYPVRMYFSEHEGANCCSISFALNGEPFKNNQQNASIGQFYFDDNTAAGHFPASGLIT